MGMDWVSVLTRSRDFGEELVKPPLFLPDLPSSHYHCLEGKPFFLSVLVAAHGQEEYASLLQTGKEREREKLEKKPFDRSNGWPGGAK
jgi:hypothetical protein